MKMSLFNITFIELTDYGWHKENGQLMVTWDTETNLHNVQCTVDFLTTGCKCKMGCATKRCKHSKKDLSAQEFPSLETMEFPSSSHVWK